MEIFLDTETTGLTRLSYANKFNFQQWPRMVQLAWIIVDDGIIVSRYSTLIKPVGFLIPSKATWVHGISHSQAARTGVPVNEALVGLNEALGECSAVVAHNVGFDLGVIVSEALRMDTRVDLPPKRICTMHLGASYLRREKGIRSGGFPKLSQLYETLFGFGYSGQHHAESDVIACFHVYRKLKQLGLC